MFRKLLKYDFKAMLKYWWILAIASVGATVIGAVCFAMMTIGGSMTEEGSEFISIVLYLVGMLGYMVSLFGIAAFAIATEIFIFIRFFKHFFSDEGYLTFTLPVKRVTLLNSKLLAAFVLQICTITIAIVEYFFVFIVGGANIHILESDFWEGIFVFITSIFEAIGLWAIVYLLELLLLYVIVIVCSTLLIFICITFASVIIKKFKVLAAVGIYYVVSYIISAVTSFGGFFALFAIAILVMSFPINLLPAICALIIFMALMLYGVVACILYNFELYLLDKKLNLV